MQFVAAMLISLLCYSPVSVLGHGSCSGSAASESNSRPDVTPTPPKHFNIILIGATGNLATKYLWPGLFEMFKARFSKNAVRFQIYGGARKDMDEGRKFMSDLILNSLRCFDDEECKELKTKFVEATQYVRLKTERDFKELSEKLFENTQSIYGLQGSPVTYEEGRLVYLSIPPSTLGKTAKFVNTYLRPKVGRPWFRVVLEKPFGSDFESAKSLTAELSRYFDESEMYRVDHYLGKTVVKQILPFRYINKKDFEHLWNRDHIEQVDIVMKEKDDVAGRTEFYNEVGIIRDVMQNHLTELLALIAMDLPTNSGNITEILENKVRVLQQLRLPTRRSILTAQYTTYNKEWLKDEEVSLGNMSVVPTFAASLMFVDNARWDGVPFMLMSGKKLDEKASYIRLRFKNSHVCMRVTDDACNWKKQLVFNIGGGSNVRMPTQIAVSRGLPTPRFHKGWSILPPSESQEAAIFGQSPGEMTQFVPDLEVDAYLTLLGAVFDGERNMFTSTDFLLASWQIWTPLLIMTERERPRQYLGRGKDAERLDFIVTSRSLQWQLDDRDEVVHDSTGTAFEASSLSTGSAILSQVPSTYRNCSLVLGSTTDVVRRLVEEISSLAEVAKSKQELFHLAVSGGTTAIPIFAALAAAISSWDHIHIWMVDERCISVTSIESNYNLIYKHLLQRVDIPHWNFHPMIGPGLDCVLAPAGKDDMHHADILYEAQLARIVKDSRLDYVILGIGPDGHTASLFPGQASLDESNHLVTMSFAGENTGAPLNARMTLTFKAINNAKNVSVVALGAGKHDILTSIEDVNDAKRFPVTGVKSETSGLKWFIDRDALFGDNVKHARLEL